MTISFTCPHCGQQTEVADRFAGREGPCVNCESLVTIPQSEKSARAVSSPKKTIVVVLSIATIVVVLAGGLITLLYLLLAPAMAQARVEAMQLQCTSRLESIAAAMNAYHDDYGSFPPAYTVDEDGKPMHSWRVLILPYLTNYQQWLANEYDMEQPWDSQHNSSLLRQMPFEFSSPNDTADSSTETSFMIVAGPGTAFSGSEWINKKDILDGPKNTILVVEAAGQNVPWTQTQDLDFEAINFSTNQVGGLNSEHSEGVTVLFADGSVHFIPKEAKPEHVEALFTIDGGEKVKTVDVVDSSL